MVVVAGACEPKRPYFLKAYTVMAQPTLLKAYIVMAQPTFLKAYIVMAQTNLPREPKRPYFLKQPSVEVFVKVPKLDFWPSPETSR